MRRRTCPHCLHPCSPSATPLHPHPQVVVIAHSDQRLGVKLLARRLVFGAHSHLEFFRQLEHEVGILAEAGNTLVVKLTTHIAIAACGASGLQWGVRTRQHGAGHAWGWVRQRAALTCSKEPP